MANAAPLRSLVRSFFFQKKTAKEVLSGCQDYYVKEPNNLNKQTCEIKNILKII